MLSKRLLHSGPETVHADPASRTAPQNNLAGSTHGKHSQLYMPGPVCRQTELRSQAWSAANRHGLCCVSQSSPRQPAVQMQRNDACVVIRGDQGHWC